MGNVSVYQVLWPIALALIALFGGLWIKQVSKDSDSAKAAAKDAKAVADKANSDLHAFKERVFTEYVRREDQRLGEDRVLEQIKLLDSKITNISEQLATKRGRDE